MGFSGAFSKNLFNAQTAEMLAGRSTQNLCELFDLTDAQPVSQSVADVRGAIMTALEQRDPEAFSRWIEEGYDASPRVYFLRVN